MSLSNEIKAYSNRTSNQSYPKNRWCPFTKAILVFLLVFAASPVSAKDTPCTGTLSGTVKNVVVPSGSTCDCDGATVKGSIKVYGSLNINRSTVSGSIKAMPGHGFVRIGFGHATGDAVVIKGNVKLKGGDGDGSTNPSGFDAGTTIKGGFQFEGNNHNLVLRNGTVTGSVKVEMNTGTCVITGNTIRGNLKCKENTSACTLSGNRVSGNTMCE